MFQLLEVMDTVSVFSVSVIRGTGHCFFSVSVVRGTGHCFLNVSIVRGAQ